MLSQDEQWLLTEKYRGEKSAGFFADCKRLKAGEPLGYIIGHIPFLGCTIHLDSHPLIPRSETEFWTEQAITELQRLEAESLGRERKDAVAPMSVLDLCAGSGCIGVGIAKAIPEATVHFAELDARHLPTIEKNVAENLIIFDKTKYQVFQSDLFANISDTYDYILSNPPYVDPAFDRTESSVKDFEPASALYGGHLGLELIEHIIAAAPQFLNANGQLWLEHEPEQAAAIQVLATKAGFSPTTHIDQYDVARYSVLVVK